MSAIDPYRDLAPGVVVLDPHGDKWISLGSGHVACEIVYGPANEWCGIDDSHIDKRDPTKRCMGYVGFKGVKDYERDPSWTRTGDSIQTLTLSPSVHCSVEKGGCGSHGYIENGKWREC